MTVFILRWNKANKKEKKNERLKKKEKKDKNDNNERNKANREKKESKREHHKYPSHNQSILREFGGVRKGASQAIFGEWEQDDGGWEGVGKGQGRGKEGAEKG